MAKANIAAARGFHFVEAYCVVLVIYIALCLAIARAFAQCRTVSARPLARKRTKECSTVIILGKVF
ncbi:polar amino acid ABC transporter inner membrane subunit [Klebsiella aerogenes]|nr:polar amino acid ABC transporter inner membrane subunit [Klebsiella aerogenes]